MKENQSYISSISFILLFQSINSINIVTMTKFVIWYIAQFFNNQLHYDMIRINAYINSMFDLLQTVFKSCLFHLEEIENRRNISL